MPEASKCDIRLRWSREGNGASASTDIRLRWSREGNGASGCYKHSAPLEPGREWGVRMLPTFGSAGAGKGIGRPDATNTRLRWSREGNGASGSTDIRLRWSREGNGASGSTSMSLSVGP